MVLECYSFIGFEAVCFECCFMVGFESVFLKS